MAKLHVIFDPQDKVVSRSEGLHVERTEFLIADQSKDAQDLMIDYLATTDATGELPLLQPRHVRASAQIGPCAWPLDERAVSRRWSGRSSDDGNQGAP